ncbi:TIGR00730 family Rossman fold protein [Bacteroides mediterraneensis]|uniref:LOG family protein n=1 Tax=Bacteroides mediterraneensis TaxID=1841856 RepID=UPI0026EC045E|nr:TIGR00730 family Rossman fold protein [Bacteroides mediterraneensis]
MNKIAVFCSASDTIAPVFMERAKELGVWLGQHHKWLVYGGSNTGLMEVLAKSAKENGAMIMGVVPTKLEENGKVSDLLDVSFHSVNLSDRKDIMVQEAEVMVALPGGIGTLDEVFHVMASCSIGYHDKRVIFYNIDGFWNDLLAFLERLEAAHFAHRPLKNYFEVANTFDELTRLLE